MVEENKTEAPATAVKETEDKSGEPVARIIEPSLVDDVQKLENLNLLRSVTLRMQGGRHPRPEIEALLQRRLNIPRESFQGPYAIRLICTLMMIFVASAIFWGVLWGLSSMLSLTYFLRMISTGMATLFAAVAGIAVFFPSSIPEEKTLIIAIEERMNELRSELGKIQPETSELAAKEATLTDSLDSEPEPDTEPPVPANNITGGANSEDVTTTTSGAE